ncbi:unnamed protein product, partial [Bubo scandiacus]
SLIQGEAEKAGIVQPGEEKAPGGSYQSFQYLKGAYRKDVEGLFTRACSDRTE